MENKTKNILIIRSATRILNSTIDSLKKEFPDSTITVLAPESARANLESHPDVDAMISAGNVNRMSVFSLKSEVIRKMRCGLFDMTVSLYNIDHGMGYSNIDCIAWASGAKTIRGYNARGTFSDFDGWGVLKKYILEKTSFIWIILNGLATVVLFSFITLGLLCEWAICKLFTSDAVKSPRLNHNKWSLRRKWNDLGLLKALRLEFLKKFSSQPGSSNENCYRQFRWGRFQRLPYGPRPFAMVFRRREFHQLRILSLAVGIHLLTAQTRYRS